MRFSEILKRRRLEGGLSFQSLGQRSRVDLAYLHRLENERATRPGRNIVIRIVIGLDLDLQETDHSLIIAGHLPRANPRMHQLQMNSTPQ